jgi:hypothetical protein
MDGVHPVVRYLIVCEDVQVDPDNRRRATLVNLISTIHSLEQPAFPLLCRELCVFVQMTECQGSAEVELRIVHADTGQFVYPGPQVPWRADLPSDPLEVVGLPFRIRNIEFPEAGLYWVQLWYNSQLLAQASVLLR